MDISTYQPDDWPEFWRLVQPAIADGESYPCPMDMTENDAKAYWLAPDKQLFVAREPSGDMVGVYYLRPDQGGLGDHVCNAGYVVASHARGRGLAGRLCDHSQATALEIGYLAMRFNLVVATNQAGVSAWKRAGFEVIGTAPRAFRRKDREFVDAHIMYKWLGPSP